VTVAVCSLQDGKHYATAVYKEYKLTEQKLAVWHINLVSAINMTRYGDSVNSTSSTNSGLDTLQTVG